MKKNKTITSLIMLIIVLFSLFTITACSFKGNIKDDKPLKIGYSLWHGHLPLYVAYEKGFFEEEGIDVELIDIGTNYQELIDGVIAGRLDIGSGIFHQTMNIEARHPGLFYTFHLIGESLEGEGISSAIVVLKDSGLTSLKNLENKIIGSDKSYIDIIHLKTLLKSQNINAEIAEIDSKIALTALASGKIDALYATSTSTIANAQKNLDTKLLDTNLRARYLGNPFWRTGYIALTEFVDQNPEKIKAYMRAVDRAIDLIENDKNREIINPILLKYVSILNNETVGEASIDKFAKSTDPVDMNQLQNTVDVLVKNGVLEKEIDVERFYLSYSRIR